MGKYCSDDCDSRINISAKNNTDAIRTRIYEMLKDNYEGEGLH